MKKEVEKLKSGSESSGSHSGRLSSKSGATKDKLRKYSRVEFEKEQQLKLMKDKLKSRRGRLVVHQMIRIAI